MALAEWCESADDTISCMAEAMKAKYDKYWDKSNMALAVACFLDPRYKKKLVEYFMGKIYHERAAHEVNRFIDVVNKLFQAYLSSTPEASKPNSKEPSHPHGDADLGIDDIEQFLYEDAAVTSCDMNELELYLKEKPIRWVDPTGKGAEFNILSWWNTHQGTFPVLSRLARDVLAIQVSTVASESAFSAGGRVVDPFRSRLEPEVVEALICTKDWTTSSRKGNNKSFSS